MADADIRGIQGEGSIGGMVRIKTLALGVAVFAIPLLAHHSFKTTFLSDRTVTVQGVVINAEWMNPHVMFYVDVMDGDGKIGGWRLETSAPNALLRQGWKRDAIKAGDRVTATGYPAKDGGPYISLTKIAVTDGKAYDFPDASKGPFWQELNPR